MVQSLPGNDAQIFARNVKQLGVDLSRLDAVIISHRHGDHTSTIRSDPALKIPPLSNSPAPGHSRYNHSVDLELSRKLGEKGEAGAAHSRHARIVRNEIAAGSLLTTSQSTCSDLTAVGSRSPAPSCDAAKRQTAL